MYNSIKAFDAKLTKLKLLIHKIEWSDFSYFENCQIFKNNTKSICLTNRFVEMLNKLEADFLDFNIHLILLKMMFILLFNLKLLSWEQTHFTVMNFKNEKIWYFKILITILFSYDDLLALRNVIIQMATALGLTYIYEQLFLRMKQIESVHRSWLTD